MEKLETAVKYAWSWLLVIGQPILIACGLIYDNSYAMNVVTFICWLTTIVATAALPVLLLGEPGRAIAARAAQSQKVPALIDHACDILGVILLAAYGHFLLASLWTYQLIVSMLVLQKGKELSPDGPHCGREDDKPAEKKTEPPYSRA